MNGLDISREYFKIYGKPALEQDFSEILPYLAIGFVGAGSERFGFDDEFSRDHDFEPGFCIFLPDENVLDRRSEFLLERMYAKLPKEFMGLERLKLSPVGGNRNGCIRTADFYTEKTGTPDGMLTINEWLSIPDEALAEAVNGEVFLDNFGEFTEIRNRIVNMPEDIKLKRLAGNILIMAQSGQYSFQRSIKHGEIEAAALAINEFVNAGLKVYFLLNNKYKPYYKWSFRALREISDCREVADKLSFCLLADHTNPEVTEKKIQIIEDISQDLINRLGLKIADNNLEETAYKLNDKIPDGYIRNLNIFIGA